MQRLLKLTLAAALAAAPSLAAAAGPVTRVLAPNGDVYAVTQGLYGDLFPDGGETVADDPVLAVTVIRPDGSSETMLVPATAGPTAEELASLVLGPDGETLHLLWQSSAAGSSLRLATFGGGGWTGAVDVSRAVPVLRGSPRAVVTRDRVELPAGVTGPAAEVHRSVLHVIWLEEGGDGVIYAPLVIEDGSYVGDHELFALDRLVASAVGPAPPAPASPLAPALEPGGDRGVAVAAFVFPGTDRLVGVELRMVDGVLSRIGDGLRGEILDLAGRLEPGSPRSLENLAAGARAYLVEAGSGLRPALLTLLATEIERYILVHGADWAFQPEAMADRTRLELIGLGAGFDRTPVRNTSGPNRPSLVNVGHRSEAAPIASHDLRLRVTAVRPVPALPAGAAGSLFLSGDGADALVAWERDGVVFFRESDGTAESGWSPVSSLGIEAGDDDLIEDLLRDRVRGR